MELDRENIERRDFPQARRGYDQEEVDRHLRAIADAVDGLRRTQSQQQPTLAGTAASRVEAIVAAAEASAREIEEKARADAAERVRRAEEVVDRLFGHAQGLQQEMGEVLARISALKSSVEAIEGDVAPAQPAAAPAPAAPEPAVAEPEPAAAAPQVSPVEAEPEPAPAVVEEAEAQAREAGADGGRASEGARLIALNMALSGAPREETARYLRENFDLDDQDDLLDDVYARAGS